jgi:hypothetical protein
MAKPEKLLDLPEGFEIWRISPLLLKEQDKNARVQSSQTFKALVRNVKKRGALESLPFCARDGETFWIISGHHRIRASISAGLASVIVLVDPKAKSRAEIIAKQVAHNAINGTDDPAVLLQLLDEIDDVDALLESAVSRQGLEKMSAPVRVPDVAVDYDWKTVTFAFLPEQVKALDALCDHLAASDKVMTADVASHAKLVKAMKDLGHVEEIRSLGAIVFRMVEIVTAHVNAKKPDDSTEAPSTE